MGEGIYILRRLNARDAHAQPTNRRWNGARLVERSIDELIGVCKGLVSDLVINEEEVGFLTTWMRTHQDVLTVWPANAIAARIDQILADKIIDREERQDLFQLIGDLLGQNKMGGPVATPSTDLPLTKPAPPVFFRQHQFCLTGRFVLGPRANVEHEIRDRGGSIQPTVTQQTNYLVIGIIGSTDWLHSTHGRKIEQAVQLAERGLPIAIVSEEHFADHLLE